MAYFRRCPCRKVCAINLGYPSHGDLLWLVLVSGAITLPLCVCSLGSWNATLTLSEKGFYGMACPQFIRGHALTVQKNTRDSTRAPQNVRFKRISRVRAWRAQRIMLREHDANLGSGTIRTCASINLNVRTIVSEHHLAHTRRAAAELLTRVVRRHGNACSIPLTNAGRDGHASRCCYDTTGTRNSVGTAVRRRTD